MKPVVHLLNGPNLNLLGQRQPEIYGRTTLADVETLCTGIAEAAGLELRCRQTNHEGQMVDWIQEARTSAGLVINPAGFSYHSVPVLDALLTCECPVVEVHISNIYRREAAWRSKTIMSVAVTGVISGLGTEGYRHGMDYLVRRIRGEQA